MLRSAPRRSRLSTSSPSPQRAASCRGDQPSLSATLTLAPQLRITSQSSRSPKRAALCKALSPSSSCRFTEARCNSNKAHASLWPFAAARCSGDRALALPWLSADALACISSSQASAWPSCAARCSAVNPASFAASTWPELDTRYWTHSRWPCLALSCRGVVPSVSAWLTAEPPCRRHCWSLLRSPTSAASCSAWLKRPKPGTSRETLPV
mmetsp:Transcript_95437/g.307995  ORF Transcript_95437/g.307995 Transcript_95437/m.307995 type:complete len:210 (-) Transcript_95437:138-767(-)